MLCPINAAAVTGGIRLDLASGMGTIAGRNLYINGTIEKVIGGDGNDTLLGNDAANAMQGMRGDDWY